MDTITDEMDTKVVNQINWCQIFLQYITISDIVAPDGKYIDYNAKAGRRNAAFLSTWKWLIQQQTLKED